MNDPIKNNCFSCGKVCLLNFKTEGKHIKMGDYICLRCLMDLNSRLYNQDNKKPDVLSQAFNPL